MSVDVAALSRQFGIPTASALHEANSPRPVYPELAGLFARGGLPRGDIVQLTGPHALSLAIATSAAATREHQWCAGLGLGELSVSTLADFGVELDYFVTVDTPAQDWLRVAGILNESFDLLVIKPGFVPTDGDRARLAAKVRERGSSVIALDRWPHSAEQLTVTDTQWTGVAHGSGRLTQCRLTVRTSRTGTHTLLLPDAQGRIGPVVRGV